MLGMFLAPLAEFLHVQARWSKFFVLACMIVRAVADSALHHDEIIL